MADYEMPLYMLSRVRYFNGQFLKDGDFIDDQKYHTDRRDRHQRLLHVTGIAEGLGLSISADKKSVSVAPGTAVDDKGRTILLSAATSISVPAGSSGTLYLEISFREKESDMADPKSTVAANTRFTQDPLITLKSTRTAGTVLLSEFSIVAATNTIGTESTASRVYSGVRLPGPSGSAISLRARTDGLGAELSAGLRVTGTVEAASFTLSAPKMDVAPVIATRTVPAGQGASNERTELILFHGNDGDNSSGPDVITLRAPSIRLQTYNDASVADINNAKGSVDRLTIDPYGKVQISTPDVHLQLRREKTATTGGTVMFLELLQDDVSPSAAVVPEVYPSIRFHHLNRYWQRLEARADGFHFKIGNLTDDTYRNIFAASLRVSPSSALRGANVAPLMKFGNDGDYTILHRGTTASTRNTLAVHVETADAFGVYSSGWTRLMDIAGGTGDMYLKGNLQAARFSLAAAPGDPAPIIATRTIPAGQGNQNERTELILFHSNDGDNASGPDTITLRAPAIRLQTYNDANVLDIDNDAGSNDRLTVDPYGVVTAHKGLAVPAGEKVTGIQIVDFKEVYISIGKGNDNQARSGSATVTFSQPIVKVATAVKSYNMWYDTREVVKGVAVESSATFSGNTATVTVRFILRDSNWDDDYSANARVLVIAVLEKAV